MIEVVHAGDLGPGAPPTTFWIQCYAHERYVADSIRSALAQEGPPLDILISDDASPDRTFEIASAIARVYAGPHRVSLLRSTANRGMFGHVDEVVPYLGGGFIVWQSSDDVAAPDRAARLFEAASPPDVSAAWSNHRLIDGEGYEQGLGLLPGVPYSLDLADFADGRSFDFTFGGTLGFDRSVLDAFGPLPTRSAGLEHIFAFRAALLGRTVYLDAPLVDRRRHADSLTPGMSARDNADDPLAVHMRRLNKRIDILANLADLLHHPAGAEHAALAPRLAAQADHDKEALDALQRFRAALAAAVDPTAAEWQHAACRYDPPALALVGTCAPGVNLLAYEGRYHAVPQSVGRVEPCGLRCNAYPGVVSAWTLAELAAALAAQGTAFELAER